MGGVPAAEGTPAVWPFSSQAWLSWLRSLKTLNHKCRQSETVGWSSFLDHHQSWQILMCLNQLEYWVRLPQIFLVWGKYIWSAISETSNKNTVVLYIVNSFLKVSTWLGITYFWNKLLRLLIFHHQIWCRKGKGWMLDLSATLLLSPELMHLTFFSKSL